MKRYFAELNGYNCVLFVDNEGYGYCIHEENFDEPLTLEAAKNADYSNFEGCETAEECAEAIGTQSAYENIFTFSEDDFRNITEF